MQKSSKSNNKKTQRGLGKGLGALLQHTDKITEEKIEDKGTPVEIEVASIVANPYQPRTTFSEDALSTLMDSIKQYGLIQPIIVRKVDDGYQLVAGERRWRASKALGLKKIPAIIKDYSTEEVSEIALVENLQRQDLDPVEEAYAYKKLMNTFKLTQEAIAAKLGRSRSHIANMVRLLQLPEFLQNELSAGELTIGQVRPLLALKTEALQLEALERIKDLDLNSRQVEELVKKLDRPTDANKKRKREDSAEIRALAERLKVSLGTPVKIKLKAGKKVQGKIEIAFTSEKELNRLLAYMDEDVTSEEEISFHL